MVSADKHVCENARGGYPGNNTGKSTRFQQCMSAANLLHIGLNIGKLECIVVIAKMPKLCLCLEFGVRGIHDKVFIP